MTIDSLLPKELSEILNSPEFDDEAGMLIESMDYTDNDLVISFSIRFSSDKNTANQLWQISMPDIEMAHVLKDWTQDIEIYSNHVSLLEYHDINSELYFKGTTDNSQGLYIDIVNALLQLSNNWIEVAKYLLTPERVNELSQQGYGLFARGPKTVLQIYAECLKANGIKPIFIGEYDPVIEYKVLKLLKLGESYFISHAFLFERIT